MRWRVRPPRWKRWFAWHPVEIEGESVWLEVVERKFIGNELGAAWLYRNIRAPGPMAEGEDG